MIWESSYWKEPLLASASYLRRARLSDRMAEKTFVRIEKEIFLGFYAIRKLLETFKVSDSTKAMTFDIPYHPVVRTVDYMNWHDIDKNYDLSSHHIETRDIKFLSNQVIHSYVFMVSELGGRFNGVFVASDRERHRKCYFVHVSHILTAFRTVGRDYPSHSSMRRDKTGQWVGQAW